MTSDGFLALPEGGTGAAVLVLHAWWGLNDDVRALCRRLAGEGFVAYAPDLYGGGPQEWPVAATIPEAEVLRDELDADSGPARSAIAAGSAFLARLLRPARGSPSSASRWGRGTPTLPRPETRPFVRLWPFTAVARAIPARRRPLIWATTPPTTRMSRPRKWPGWPRRCGRAVGR